MSSTPERPDDRRSPRHKPSISADRHAIAPYNFVSLPAAVVPAEELPSYDCYAPGRHTGRITCTLTTATPTYVRAALTRQEFAEAEAERQNPPQPARAGRKHKPEFFYTLDPASPVIPGSSLRGMLRSLVEIAGYGKVDRVSKRALIYRSVGDTSNLGAQYRSQIMDTVPGRQHYYIPRVAAGYMEIHGSAWSIRPAMEINGATFARISHHKIQHLRAPGVWQGCRNAHEVWFTISSLNFQPVREGFLHIQYAKVTAIDARPQPGYYHGALVTSGRMASKRSEAVVFTPDPHADLLPVADELVSIYREQISKEQRALLGDEGVLRPGQPVFYLLENGKLLFFGHTMMQRLPYPHTPRDFIPDDLHQDAITDVAEAIFGFVRASKQEETKQARSGRVFVSNAVLTSGQDDVLLNNGQAIVPRILGSPKPTTFQHYLVQTSDEQQQLRHYGHQPITDTVIRGHKLYWHQGSEVTPATLEDRTYLDTLTPQQHDTDTQHTHFIPVRAGLSFTFTIAFENLSDVELGALLWVLRTGADPRFRLKLGMGKALGMGSVAVQLDALVESQRTAGGDKSGRYDRLFAGSAWHNAERALDAQRQTALVKAFTDYICEQLRKQQAAGTQAFEELARIKELFALLTWREQPLRDDFDGPNKNTPATRYMEIERVVEDQHKTTYSHIDSKPARQKGQNWVVNEYGLRPVLPGPLELQLPPPPPPPPLRRDQTYTGWVRREDPASGNWVVETETAGKHLVICATVPQLRSRDLRGKRVSIRTSQADPTRGVIRELK